MTDDGIYHVIINDEEQYSVWPAGDPVPPGWRAGAFTGGYAECLAHIDQAWTDMRPLSLRRWMAGYTADDHAEPPPAEDEPLVARLSAGPHPVEVESGRPERLREALRRRRFVVAFTGTAGGTRLAVRLDPAASDVTALDRGAGRLRLVGELTLDDRPVVCTVTVGLPDLVGDGHLTPVEPRVGLGAPSGAAW